MAIPVTLDSIKMIVKREVHVAANGVSILMSDSTRPIDESANDYSVGYYTGKHKAYQELLRFLEFGLEPGYGA